MEIKELPNWIAVVFWVSFLQGMFDVIYLRMIYQANKTTLFQIRNIGFVDELKYIMSSPTFSNQRG